MSVAAAVFCLLGALAPVAVQTAPAVSSCQRARYFLLNWHLRSGGLDSCEAALATIIDTGRQREERLALRAQLLIVRGEFEASPTVKARWYTDARAAADSLRAVNDQNPLGHLWWAVAQGRVLELRGKVSAAMGAAALRRENERALDLDPNCALASYALGRMYEELPGPFGGSLNKADAWLRRGVASDPNYTIIRLGLARVLAKQGRRDEAVAELHRLLAVTHPSNPAEAALNDRPAAKALLDSLDRD
jgi:predicted Zn-dependent protease